MGGSIERRVIAEFPGSSAYDEGEAAYVPLPVAAIFLGPGALPAVNVGQYTLSPAAADWLAQRLLAAADAVEPKRDLNLDDRWARDLLAEYDPGHDE